LFFNPKTPFALRQGGFFIGLYPPALTVVINPEFCYDYLFSKINRDFSGVPSGFREILKGKG